MSRESDAAVASGLPSVTPEYAAKVPAAPAPKGYVIFDPHKGGYAKYDCIEGWHFTIIESAAAIFRNRESAERIRRTEYSHCETCFVHPISELPHLPSWAP